MISQVKKRIFCPKRTIFGPKLAFLVNLGQAMQAYSVPCWWAGWWLWRAGCISQDTYLLYVFLYLLCRSCEEKRHEIQEFNYFFSSLMWGLGRHWGEISSSSWGKETLLGDNHDVDEQENAIFLESPSSRRKESGTSSNEDAIVVNLFLQDVVSTWQHVLD